ncbi:MFS transporter [Demequina zhanjiangensis]|uniref:MFS transporter n=1 Tax=Demequina zhanjiangensis TaxID=3051659 RepID=A0ABT8G323_9MICO|nr:MFS transporter [Demequina sp. SYSU T00b26]MDN4473493.1 MFS transporter [Demequina sp. SYSU T00b26]
MTDARDPLEPEPHVEVVASPAPGAGEGLALPPTLVGSPPSEAPSVAPRRAYAALAALAVSMFLYVSNEIAPLGLNAVVAESLGESEATVGLLISVGAFVVILTSVPLALAASRVPYRWTLTGAGTLFTVAMALSATADTFGELVVGRVLGAAAHAMFWAVVTPAAAGMFPVRVRGRMVARVMIGSSVAGVAGLPALTWLAQAAGWRTSYMAMTAVSAVVAIAIAVLLPTFKGSEGSTARGELPSWPAFVRVLAIAALTVGSLAVLWTYITPYLLQVPRFSATAIPLLLAIGGALGVVAMVAIGRFLDRFPVRSLVVGLTMLLAVYLGLGQAGSVPAIAAAMVMLQGFCWSIIVAAMMNWAMRHAPGRTDVAVAAYNSAYNAGNAGGPIIGATLLGSASAGVLPWASAALVAGALLVVLTSRPWHLLERMRARRRPRETTVPVD